MAGVLTEDVKREFITAVKWLVEVKKVSVVTGDCGFMMFFQHIARSDECTHGSTPVVMSALAQLPAVTCAYAQDEKVIIMTANGATLEPMHDLLCSECGVEIRDKRFIIVGCEDVPGFEAVALGEKVDTEKVTPGIVAAAQKALVENPNAKCILLECTELPPYSDALRIATGLPVFDAITCCDFFMTGFQDNKRFGTNDWQKDWDGKQEKYEFGQNLNAKEKAKLTNKSFKERKEAEQGEK